MPVGQVRTTDQDFTRFGSVDTDALLQLFSVQIVAVAALTSGLVPHESEESLVLLQIDGESGAAGLERVLKCLIEQQRVLDLSQSAKLGLVVLYVEPVGHWLLLDEGMRPADRDVVDSDISVVASADLDLVDVVEVDDVDLLLLLVLSSVGVVLIGHLEGLEDDVVRLGPVYVVQLVLLLVGVVDIFIPRFAQLTVEGPPGVSGHELSHFLVLIPSQPLPQATQVDRGHGASALTRADEWIGLRVLLLTEADAAHVRLLLAFLRFLLCK